MDHFVLRPHGVVEEWETELQTKDEIERTSLGLLVEPLDDDAVLGVGFDGDAGEMHLGKES